MSTPLPGHPRNARLHYVTFGALLSRRRFCDAFDLTRPLTSASCFRPCASDAFVCEAGGVGVQPFSVHALHRPRGSEASTWLRQMYLPMTSLFFFFK